MLGFTEMEEISGITGVPLVLHGGIGIPENQIKKAILLSHYKINVNTELQQVGTAAVRHKLIADAHEPQKILQPGKEAIIAAARETLVRFDSSGKA